MVYLSKDYSYAIFTLLALDKLLVVLVAPFDRPFTIVVDLLKVKCERERSLPQICNVIEKKPRQLFDILSLGQGTPDSARFAIKSLHRVAANYSFCLLVFDNGKVYGIRSRSVHFQSHEQCNKASGFSKTVSACTVTFSKLTTPSPGA